MTDTRAHVIVVGNEKGGSGKSTTAMHLIVALLRRGRSVASVDLDLHQRTLSRYLENRRAFAEASGILLPMPDHQAATPPAHAGTGNGEDKAEAWFHDLIERLRPAYGAVVVDTPGSDSPLGRIAHSYADTLITPLIDSFVDLDVLARVDGASLAIIGFSHYSEMVWQQKLKRARREGTSMDWIVMRNRLTGLHARNKARMADTLGELSRRIGFRLTAGFAERVVYRELFLKGLTMMDLRDADPDEGLTLSHVAGRQEVRTLLEFLRL